MNSPKPQAVGSRHERGLEATTPTRARIAAASTAQSTTRLFSVLLSRPLSTGETFAPPSFVLFLFSRVRVSVVVLLYLKHKTCRVHSTDSERRNRMTAALSIHGVHMPYVLQARNRTRVILSNVETYVLCFYSSFEKSISVVNPTKHNLRKRYLKQTIVHSFRTP